jgi:MoxR-like ATPase
MSTGASTDRDPDAPRPVALSTVATPEPRLLPLDAPAITAFADRLGASIREGVRIRDEALEIVLCVVLAGGHLLLEDRPGVGKTQLARSLAGGIGGRFSRVQATVDLLPADILGATVWHAGTETFAFHPGPVFANVVLVDELNRATPKTQSGLLEAMQERQVTVDGHTHPLERPFTVVATQNPTVGYDGTYVLPPAQLDRFLARVSLGYPSPAEEVALLRERPSANVRAAGGPDELIAAQAGVERIHAAEPLLEYVVALLHATRRHPLAATGASPRSGLGLLAAARARAAVVGRDFVLPDDVQALAPAVLAHRIEPVAAAPPEAQDEIVADALREVPAR